MPWPYRCVAGKNCLPGIWIFITFIFPSTRFENHFAKVTLVSNEMLGAGLMP